MQWLRRKFVISAAAIVAMGTADRTLGAEKGIITVSQASDVLTLDPMLDSSPVGVNVFQNIFDSLTRIGADGSISPLLAASWQASSDARVWEFTIRTGAKFHNGDPVTAQDVVWSYQRALKEQTSTVRPFVSKVRSVEGLDRNRVRFILTEPYAPFNRQVSLISILPQKAFEQMGGARFASTPIGSGPFKVVTWVKDDRVELEGFSEYWGGAPKFKTLVFKPVPSEASRVSALASGELDVVPNLPPSMVQALSSRPGLTVEKVVSNRVVYIAYDVTNSLLSDIRMRQAIDMAIDRNAITTQLLRGLGKPSGQMVAPATFGYSPDIYPTQFDPQQAKKLVAETGYAGQNIVLQYPNNAFAFGNEVAQGIANYLKKAGINVEVQGMDYSAFFPLWGSKRLNGLSLFSYGPSTMDADLPLASLYEKTGSGAYWIDDRVQNLIKKQRAETDKDRRREIIEKILQLSKENLPFSPLYTEIHAYGIQSRVRWTPRPDTRLYFKDAEIVE